MKIGIFTINDDWNYGNRLQNYAVQEVLLNNNIKCNTIRKMKLIDRIKYIVKINIKKCIRKDKYIRQIKFYKFNKKIKFRYYNNNLESLNKEYDYFITGSDQVWNPNFGRMSDIDFLIPFSKEKRISFSASFGVNNIPDNLKEYYTNNLLQIKSISVRESKGKELVHKLTGRTDVEVLVDPTMLLTADEWDKVSKKPKQLHTDKYILNYFLGDLSEERKNQINKIAKENDCEVINILDKNSPFYQTGPSEFLYLEKHAFLICTDSFHSSVFAIIYNIPFLVFDREDSNERMNSRLETLLKKFDLEDRKYTGIITDNNLKHDYKHAYEILEKEKEKAMNFLREALAIK